MPLVQITAHMESPVITTGDLHLDELLISAHPQTRGGALVDAAGRFARPPLPVRFIPVHRSRVYACTAAIFPDEARRAEESHVKRRDNIDLESLRGPWHPALGPGKNRMVQYQAIIAPYITWYAIGNRRGIQRLVQRITHIGLLRNIGYGRVAQWECVNNHDVNPGAVWVDGHIVQRALPDDVFTHGAEGVVGAVEAPYWHPARYIQGTTRPGASAVLAEGYFHRLLGLAKPEPVDAAARHDAYLAREARRRAV